MPKRGRVFAFDADGRPVAPDDLPVATMEIHNPAGDHVPWPTGAPTGAPPL